MIMKQIRTGLIIGVLGISGMARAAIIASYDFNTDGNNLAAPVTGISSVSAFSETGFGHQGTAGDVGYAGIGFAGDDNAGVSSTGNNYYFR